MKKTYEIAGKPEYEGLFKYKGKTIKPKDIRKNLSQLKHLWKFHGLTFANLYLGCYLKQRLSKEEKENFGEYSEFEGLDEVSVHLQIAFMEWCIKVGYLF